MEGRPRTDLTRPANHQKQSYDPSNGDIWRKNQWEKDRISQLKEENKWLQLQISAFSKLVTWRKRFTASSGGLSTNEQIYLDDQQALMIVKHAASVFDQAMEQVLVIYQRGIRDLEQL